MLHGLLCRSLRQARQRWTEQDSQHRASTRRHTKIGSFFGSELESHPGIDSPRLLGIRKYMLNSLVTDEIEASWICLRTGASWGQMLVPGARGAVCALCILCGSKYRPPTHNESVEPKFENASETTSEQRYFELDFFCKKQCHNDWRVKVGVILCTCIVPAVLTLWFPGHATGSVRYRARSLSKLRAGLPR